MNICIISKVIITHSKGGVQDHIKDLTEGIVKKGHSVVILTTRHPENKEYEKTNGVEIYYIHNRKSGNYSHDWSNKLVNEFVKLNERYHFDVVHSQDASASILLKKRLNKILKIPFIISMHGTAIDEFKTRFNVGFSIKEPIVSLREAALFAIFLYRYFFRELNSIKNSDYIIATSKEQKEVIKKYYSADDKKVMIVHNGIDISKFKPINNQRDIISKYKLEREKINLLCIARFEKEKGIQNVLNAIKNVINKEKYIQLLVVGDGFYKKNILKLTKSLSIGKYVRFLGYVDINEIPYFLNYCDIFINSTNRQNGYDLTVIEAMACGKPVITTNIGSYPTAITHLKDGYLTKLKNIRELEQAILKISSDDKLRITLSKNALIKVKENFTLSSMIDNTLKVYKNAKNKYI